MPSLQDRHVVVTGGTGALGAAVVDAFVSAGAHCHVPAIEKVAPTVHYADPGKVSIATSIDLSDETSVAGFFASLPTLHALVNIAGGFAWAPIADSTAE